MLGLCAQAQTNLIIMILLPWRQPEVPGLLGPPEWRWLPLPKVGPLKAGPVDSQSLFSSIQLDGVGWGGPHYNYLTRWGMTSSLIQPFHGITSSSIIVALVKKEIWRVWTSRGSNTNYKDALESLVQVFIRAAWIQWLIVTHTELITQGLHYQQL